MPSKEEDLHALLIAVTVLLLPQPYSLVHTANQTMILTWVSDSTHTRCQGESQYQFSIGVHKAKGRMSTTTYCTRPWSIFSAWYIISPTHIILYFDDSTRYMYTVEPPNKGHTQGRSFWPL